MFDAHGVRNLTFDPEDRSRFWIIFNYVKAGRDFGDCSARSACRGIASGVMSRIGSVQQIAETSRAVPAITVRLEKNAMVTGRICNAVVCRK